MKPLATVLTGAAVGFAFVGCTSSDGPQTGGLEATLSLDADASPDGVSGVNQFISSIQVVVDCQGEIDPVTGEPWPTEMFDVNVSTSEGNDPLDTKDTLGVFKKEGLPDGADCIVSLSATSDNGEMTCGGSGIATIDASQSPLNTQLFIIVNCTTIARYGGVNVTGEFNQCAEYSQIVVSPVTQSAGNDIDVDIWCYDPDAEGATPPDLPVAGVQFLAPDGTSCGDVTVVTAGLPNTGVPAPGTPGNAGDCPSVEPPIADPTMPTLEMTATCALSNVACTIVVGISEDGFQDCVPDPVNNDNAFAVIPVFCQGFSVCGDGIVEGTEECDPCDDPSGCDPDSVPPGTGSPIGPLPAYDPDAGTWCSATCLAFNPCDNPTAAPFNCNDPNDPVGTETCQQIGCDETQTTVAAVCTGDETATGITGGETCTTCPDTFGNGCSCQDQGTIFSCESTPNCTPTNLTSCTDANDCNIASCPAGACVYTPEPPGGLCTTLGFTGQCDGAGACDAGDCVNASDLNFLSMGEPDTAVVTACSTTAATTDTTYCAADPGAPGGGVSTGTDNSGITACIEAGPPASNLSTECIGCTSITSCCTLNRCSVLVGGPCAGPPVPGDACDLCIEAACGGAFTACSGLPYQTRATLRILVTNDDGFDAGGIDAIVEALIQNPDNQVKVSAPAVNQSGSGDSTGTCGTGAITNEETLSGYPATAVDDCPADAVNYALANLYSPTEQPHVVISGINEGQNVSAQIATSVSGTVGAAKTAARTGVPALAASQGGSQGVFDPNSNFDYPAGVDAVLTWLAANRLALLQGGATPTDVTNLNVPSCDAGQVRGTLPGIPLAPSTTGAFDGQDCLSTLPSPATDVEALNNGFTTLSSVPLN